VRARALFAAAVLCGALACAGCERPEAPAAEADLALLAQAVEGFAQARAGRELEFPRDHGSHPDYRIEWWYLTANLQDTAGQPYGVQWTLFRFATRPPGSPALSSPGSPANGTLDSSSGGTSGGTTGGTAWQSEQVFMAHMAITTPDRHFAFQRYARGGDHGDVAQAGATAAPFAAWLDDWRLASRGNAWLPLELRARQDGFAMELRLEGTGPLVLQGDRGFSQKHPQGGGSHYYSQPFLAASGTLQLDGTAVPVTGQAWLDREWSSQFLQPDQAGWDWLALHLDSGEKLMLFRLRSRDAGADYRHGVLISPDGALRSLDPALIRLEPLQQTSVAGRSLPLHWRIDLPEIGRSLEVRALHPGQWLDVDFPYWEGVVTAHGADPRSRGRGYLELTGYR
jgi:predicted secreted hydrolase